MTARLRAKRGDTFVQQCTLRDSAGMPVDLASIAVRSQVRDIRGGIMVELAVAMGPGTGQFSVRAEAEQTENWPVGPAMWDVEFTQAGNRFSSATALVDVVEDVTR